MLRRPGRGLRLTDVHVQLSSRAQRAMSSPATVNLMLGPLHRRPAQCLLPAGGETQVNFDAISVADVVAKGGPGARWQGRCRRA